MVLMMMLTSRPHCRIYYTVMRMSAGRREKPQKLARAAGKKAGARRARRGVSKKRHHPQDKSSPLANQNNKHTTLPTATSRPSTPHLSASFHLYPSLTHIFLFYFIMINDPTTSTNGQSADAAAAAASTSSTAAPMTNNTNTTDNEVIVDKLQDALDALRRERDEWYRKKELTVERLRLITEEKDALSKTVQGMRHKLDQLHNSIDTEKENLPSLETSVRQLSKEVRTFEMEIIEMETPFLPLFHPNKSNTLTHSRSIVLFCRFNSSTSSCSALVTKSNVSKKPPNAIARTGKTPWTLLERLLTSVGERLSPRNVLLRLLRLFR
jgi:hypothetical protein